jgi:Uri superfamily endonuclease
LRPSDQCKGGAYLLILRLDETEEIDVGRLGSVVFPKGKYAYAGSALTSLEARVNRHFSLEKRMHWHIDFLRAKARPEEALLLRSHDDVECMINEMVGKMKGARPFALGFGCSDCGCATHLHILGSGCLSRLESFFPEKMKPAVTAK